MILLQSNYGVTISSEGITAIIILLVLGIISMWVRAFIAKPDTISSELKALAKEMSDRFYQQELKIKDLQNEIERNSEKDVDERRRHSDTIAKIESNMWTIIRDALKK
jgi:hypothetical protein